MKTKCKCLCHTNEHDSTFAGCEHCYPIIKKMKKLKHRYLVVNIKRKWFKVDFADFLLNTMQTSSMSEAKRLIGHGAVKIEIMDEYEPK